MLDTSFALQSMGKDLGEKERYQVSGKDYNMKTRWTQHGKVVRRVLARDGMETILEEISKKTLNG